MPTCLAFPFDIVSAPPMEPNFDQATNFQFLQCSLLIFLLLFIPVVLSNRPAGAALGILLLVVIFFFPGYLLLSLLSKLPVGFRLVISPVFGIVSIVTAYNMFARLPVAAYFPYLVVVLSAAGMVLVALQIRQAPLPSLWTRNAYQSVLAGSAVALTVSPLFWRSGRFSDGEFVFYGPAGQDQLYHVTMLQRLMQHIPPDNFIVSGLRPTIYHYFDDLTLALVLRVQTTLHFGTTNLFDLYYRCYPISVYFLIGALAYRVGRQLVGTARGGILSVLLLLGAGGLGWFFGVLHVAVHTPHLAAMRASLFFHWTSWEGVDSILPLVHRPAHYHSILICLAAISILLRPERSRRDWLVAGLLLGFMAGFNFTFAATFGIAAVLGSLLLLMRRRLWEALDLAWLALFVFVGSLPLTSAMLLSGFHNLASGFPFRGPNLDYPVAVWGSLLGRMMPQSLVPWAALILLPIVAFGVKLFGGGAMARLDLGEARHHGVASVFAIVFVLSFMIGIFLPYQGMGGVAVIFLQPTLWILGLFSLRPINAWLDRKKGNWRSITLFGLLGLTWVQAFVAFNFSCKAAFSQETTRALQDVRWAATPGDVVAYLPSQFTEKAILGQAEKSTNFSIIAMTGLDGYFSSETYSEFFAVPGISGHDAAHVLAQADHLYEQRRNDVGSFLKGEINDAVSARLAKDHVRWIVASGKAMQSIPSSAALWRKTADIAIYRLPP